MSDLNLNLEIKAITDDAVKAIADVTKELKGIDQQVSKGLKDPFKDFQKSAQNFGKSLRSVGTQFSKFVTGPLLGLGALAVKNFQESEQALAQVRQGLISTGNAANKSIQELKRQASELQKNSLFGDDEILQGVTAQLITFTNIAGTQFDRTQQAALDLAQRLGGDLQGATIQLGKALNDPVANLSALSRSGIQFSEAQKTLIARLVETNQLAKAQDLILDELNNQYGGSAKAAADASIGVVQLKNEFGDFLEEIGAIIAPFFKVLIDGLRDAIRFLSSLSTPIKVATVAFIALAAAIGPILIALGTLITILSSPAFIAAAGIIVAIGKAFLTVVAPVLAIAAAVALVVTRFNILRAAGLTVTQAIGVLFLDTAKLINDAFFNVINFVLNGIGRVTNAIAEFTGISFKVPTFDFSGISDTLGALRQQILDTVNINAEDLPDTVETLTNYIKNIVGRFKIDIPELFKATDEVAQNAGKNIDKTGQKVTRLGEEIRSGVASGLSSAFVQFAEGTKTADEAFKDFTKSFLSNITQMILQSLILQSINSALGLATPTSQNITAPVAQPGFAEGGLVSGPGSGTSDSISARLSNGEFVSDAKTTGYFGADFFQGLKRMARGGVSVSAPKRGGVPGFADGGMVSGSGNKPFMVEIKNSGNDKQVTNVTQRQDIEGTVISVFIEDLGKNGQVSKALQGAYGLRRGSV